MPDHWKRLSAGRLASLAALAILVALFCASSAAAQENSDCLGCHSDKAMTMVKGGNEVPLFVSESAFKKTPHGQFDCTTCHEGFDPWAMPHAAKIEPVNCIVCHADVSGQHVFHKDMVVASGSAAEQNASCRQCHAPHTSLDPTATCADCHSDVTAKYALSAHGAALTSRVDGAPDCLTCHTKSAMGGRDGRTPAQLKIAQEKMCLSCHVDNRKVAGMTTPTAGFVASYKESVHGQALRKGNAAAANCIDCHGSHDVQKGAKGSSGISRARIPETCGKCHGDIAKQYAQSTHGKTASKGSLDAPVCTDCHGEHKILAPSDPKSPVASRNVSEQVCGTCHSSVKLSEKYGIQSDRFQTFSDSYHGLAIRGGATNMANCASCHGAHDIRPASDAASMVNVKNIPKTCGKCHPGANKRFAVGKVHVTTTPKQQPVLYIIGLVYILLIIGTIGGMLAHNLLDFYKKWRRHVGKHDLHGLYVRMTLFERIQHASLMVSFIVLVITGFMLHYPDAWWVAGIRRLSPYAFEIRGLLHRAAAVVMVMACLAHVVYVLVTERGRQLVRDMFPRRKDVSDAIGMVKYGLGLAKEKPQFGRFGYIEKSEYWAPVWGSVVMTVTGVIMWAENTFIGLLTKLGWDISRTIHFYEAWLAALAIVVWHLYFVIFNPDVYPMNAAWITGTLPEEVVAEEHPLEYEEIRKAIDAKRRPADEKEGES